MEPYYLECALQCSNETILFRKGSLRDGLACVYASKKKVAQFLPGHSSSNVSFDELSFVLFCFVLTVKNISNLLLATSDES